jgi:hypothetical protein
MASRERDLTDSIFPVAAAAAVFSAASPLQTRMLSTLD